MKAAGIIVLKCAGLMLPQRRELGTAPPGNIKPYRIKGGTLAGTYTIPRFHHCLLDTLLINLTLPGPGNTITLTVGKGHAVR